jgi:site-specific recombinase XerD
MTTTFKDYLTAKRYRGNTIKSHQQNITIFMQWVTASGLHEIENIEYNNLLSYVQHEQQRGIDVATINLRLTSINKYFNFLQSEGAVSRNPAATLRIKGKAQTVTENPLKYDELMALYSSYKTLQKPVPQHLAAKSAAAHQRNMVILGLLIWQGLHSGELSKLETTHVNIDEATIYIPSTARSNSRTLKLSSQQIIQLYSYIHGGTREKLMRRGRSPLSGELERALLPGNLHNIITGLCEELKGINPQIKNALHIRASVILHWLRQHNKRQVQYMAGHRYIHSTEMYAAQETETLSNALDKHHPFS